MDVVTLGAALSIMKKMPDTAASSAAAAEDAADRAEEAARTLTIDDTLTESGQAADSKTVGDALAEKLDVADLPDTVSNANQLLSEKYVVDTEPYHFRPSGGNGADRAFDTIVGGSVVWNQSVKSYYDRTEKGITIATSNNVCSVDGTVEEAFDYNTMVLTSNTVTFLRNGRKYLILVNTKTLGDHQWRVSGFNPSPLRNGGFMWTNTAGGIWKNGIAVTVTLGEEIHDKVQISVLDLTQMFGSTIADYIYSLEQATAGAGVAWFRKYFPNDYYDYNAGELMHVSGVSAHKTYDADENIIGNYSLDSSLTLRGIPKLVDGKLSFDGDIYKPDGTVERRYGTRAYESGDESLSNAITDGTNTVYKLTTPTAEQAQSFQSPQILDPYGTEEYVTTSIVPVGHETKYPENLRAKIEGLPWNFASLIAPVEAEFKATRNYTSGSLFIVDNVLYKATANIANGGTITPNTNCTATTLSEIIAAL